ncbi:MAG: type II toxin-antitoxin system RelE/ParE family toxin [Candidatus Brocadiaceae bacterium]|nr:type II toxin-antitoxin system RelE/ParE family toxin [Candidatus Brocadiaceae bacterium]
MDYKIIWSPEALEDMRQLGSLSQEILSFMLNLQFKKYEAPQSLIQHPKIGRVVPEAGDESIRELFVFQYRIVYEIKANEIHILTVIHGKRMFDKEKSDKLLEIDAQERVSVQAIVKHRQFVLFKPGCYLCWAQLSFIVARLRKELICWIIRPISLCKNAYSHSMVLGGLVLMS